MRASCQPRKQTAPTSGAPCSKRTYCGWLRLARPYWFTLVFFTVPLTPSIQNAGNADELPDNPILERKDPERPDEKPQRTYLGRIVAQPMSHLGASWLIRPERDQEENASKSFQNLGLKEGMTVCDLGCGNGYWTLPMARAVGKKGRVLAVDIQREMLQKLKARGNKMRLENIEPILGKVNDPRLPENKVDMLLMVDVYHEFSHPQSMLWSIRRSLTSEGVVALLEYRAEDPAVPIKPLHKMSKVQIMKEYEANGFILVREDNTLPWQHLMFFARDDSPLEAVEPKPIAEVLEGLGKFDVNFRSEGESMPLNK